MAILSGMLVLVLSAAAVLAVFIAKLPENNNDNNEWIRLRDYSLPQDLYEYGLTLEWLDERGNPAGFNAKKPVVILFEGAVPKNYKSSYTLDSDIYYYRSAEEHSIADSSKDMNTELAFYWNSAGYNVGVFHYENYAQGGLQDIVKKIYSARNVCYVNNAGETVYPSENFNLTEVFVYLWLKLLETTPLNDTDTPFGCQEVRFIGNSVGANLAVSVADYLYLAYEEGLIPPYAVPNRIAMVNPWFSNEQMTLDVDFRQDAYGSALEYNAKRIGELAKKGVVFEMVEEDSNYFTSYAVPYTGLIGQEGDYLLGTEGDCALFRTILANTATLWFAQSYQNYFTDEYRLLDRAALDWYLYSVNGSDDSSLTDSYYGGPGTRPMADDIINYLSGRLYGVSAWTPTAYIRAVRGVQYKMQKKDYNNETGKYDIVTDFVMQRFQAEAKQCSDLSKTYVCGYVYYNKNNSRYVNWSADTHLKNIKVTLTLELSESQGATKIFTSMTGEDGFYCFEIEPKYYESSMTLTVLTGTKYAYAGQREINESIYEQYSTSTLNTASVYLDQTYLEKGSSLVQIIVKNCGLKLR